MTFKELNSKKCRLPLPPYVRDGAVGKERHQTCSAADLRLFGMNASSRSQNFSGGREVFRMVQPLVLHEDRIGDPLFPVLDVPLAGKMFLLAISYGGGKIS